MGQFKNKHNLYWTYQRCIGENSVTMSFFTFTLRIKTIIEERGICV